MVSEGGAEPGSGRSPALALTHGELISAASAVLLLIAMFAFRWYAVDGIPARASSPETVVSAQNAWEGLPMVRWLMLVTVVVALAALAIHAWGPSRRAVAGVRLALLALATLTAAAVTFRVLIEPPSPGRIVDQKLGAVIAVGAALGIAYGAYESVREQRLRLLGARRPRTSPNPLASDRPPR
jgi:hypothetical protein